LRWKRKEILFEERKIATVNIKEMTTEKFVKTTKKKNIIFVVSVKLIMEKKNEVIEDVAKLLEEYKDVFLVKSPLDLPPRREEDDHAISMVPGVRLQVKNLYRLIPKEREVLKI
jgi:hypothetical protein